MAVDTKKVQGRRELRFTSLDEVAADAEKLVSSPNTRVLGNWPLSQLLTHLETAVNSSIDGISAKAPWFIRLIAPLMKGRVLRKGLSPGFNLPKDIADEFYPTAASPREACERLRAAVGRVHNEKMTSRHPVFGKMTHEEWTQLHMRHAELHLSFALPG